MPDNGTFDQAPSNLTILIVDDDAPTRMLLKPAILKWGYNVIEATDGESAWKSLLSPAPPQLLIIDWMMPQLSGIELCTRIRKNLYPRYNPYIILLTQSTGTENIVAGLEAGANEFLTKPINLAELRSRVSVGKKVIAYETMLTDQNAQLKNYITTIETASALAQSASQSLGDVIKENKSADFGKKSVAHFQQLEKIDSNLNEILDIFNGFQPEDNGKDK